jgi:hypothetical protein
VLTRVLVAPDDGIYVLALLVERAELLLPQDGAVNDMVPHGCIVDGGVTHVPVGHRLRPTLVPEAAPGAVEPVLLDGLLVHADARNPMVAQDVVLAAETLSLRVRVAACKQLRVRREVRAHVPLHPSPVAWETAVALVRRGAVVDTGPYQSAPEQRGEEAY